MADQTLTPTSHKNSLDAITGSAIPILPAVGRVRRVGRAIVNWFLTSPSPQAYVRTDTAHESASSRAARIRRNQEMVDELFAEPGPDVSAFNDRGHPWAF
jgi:hypothetical protein